MREYWYWANITTVIESCYEDLYGNEFSEKVLEIFEAALTSKNIKNTAKDYAINLVKNLRRDGCDKHSAYVAAACIYCSNAFIANPEHCYFAIDLIREALSIEEEFPNKVVTIFYKAQENINEAADEHGYENVWDEDEYEEDDAEGTIEPNRISEATIGGLLIFHEQLHSLNPFDRRSAGVLGYIVGALHGVNSVLGGKGDKGTDAALEIMHYFFPDDLDSVMGLCGNLIKDRDPYFNYTKSLGEEEFKIWLSGGELPLGLENILKQFNTF